MAYHISTTLMWNWNETYWCILKEEKKNSLQTGVLSIKASLMFDFGVTLILYVFILPKVWKGYSRRHIVFYIAVRCQRTILIILVAIMKTICWISNYFIAGFFLILKVARHANLLLDGSIKNLFFFFWNMISQNWDHYFIWIFL